MSLCFFKFCRAACYNTGVSMKTNIWMKATEGLCQINVAALHWSFWLTQNVLNVHRTSMLANHQIKFPIDFTA